MSRELKFRVWNEFENKFMPSGFIGISDGKFIDLKNGSVHFDSDDKIIEQFTGLCDRNGKEIYENDLVNAEFIYKNGEKDCFYNFLITYHENESAFFYDGDLGESIPLMQISKQYDLKVIGNIHENGDLLK